MPLYIKDLLDPGAYPERPERVELTQSHVSYLLFTPEFVYKIKKPVDFGFLDFTTLDKRRFYCEEEIRLNRRLAPRAYLGVEAVTLHDGRHFVGRDGEPVEYAVKMRRLPAEACLERALEKGEANEALIGRISLALAAFHKAAATDARISSFGSTDAIRRNTVENFEQTKQFIGEALSRGLHERIKDYAHRFLEANRGAFEERVSGGFIRDCHGDIHCEHVFMEDGIEIIDCIEFNERFRFSDIVADEAFLSMDLDRRGRPDLSRALDDEYFSETGDGEGRRLLGFYKCYRAFVRGKVEAMKSAEEEVGEDQRKEALISALYYFHLSGLYASGGARPMLLIICGLPGTGKTTLADEIAGRTGFVHLLSDAVRKELAGIRPGEARPEAFGEGIYSEHFTERTYARMSELAEGFLRQGRSVILDATFSKRRYLKKAMEAAERSGAPVKVVECSAANSTVRARLEERRWAEGNVSDADWRIYIGKKAAYEEVPGPHLVVEAERPMKENLVRLFQTVFD